MPAFPGEGASGRQRDTCAPDFSFLPFRTRRRTFCRLATVVGPVLADIDPAHAFRFDFALKARVRGPNTGNLITWTKVSLASSNHTRQPHPQLQ